MKCDDIIAYIQSWMYALKIEPEKVREMSERIYSAIVEYYKEQDDDEVDFSVAVNGLLAVLSSIVIDGYETCISRSKSNEKLNDETCLATAITGLETFKGKLLMSLYAYMVLQENRDPVESIKKIIMYEKCFSEENIKENVREALKDDTKEGTMFV